MYASQKDENSSIELPVKFCIEIKLFMEKITTLKFSSLFTGMFFSRPVIVHRCSSSRASVMPRQAASQRPGEYSDGVTGGHQSDASCDQRSVSELVRSYSDPVLKDRSETGASLETLHRPASEVRESGTTNPAAARRRRLLVAAGGPETKSFINAVKTDIIEKYNINLNLDSQTCFFSRSIGAR